MFPLVLAAGAPSSISIYFKMFQYNCTLQNGHRTVLSKNESTPENNYFSVSTQHPHLQKKMGWRFDISRIFLKDFATIVYEVANVSEFASTVLCKSRLGEVWAPKRAKVWSLN